MYSCTNVKMYKCTNVQLYYCTTVQMYKCTTLHLPTCPQRLSHMATENLPVFNSSSSARLKSISTQVGRWEKTVGNCRKL